MPKWFSKSSMVVHSLRLKSSLFANLVPDLCNWRGGQLQHHSDRWLQSTLGYNRISKPLILEQSTNKPKGLSSANEILETEWQMYKQESDSRIALMMLMEGRAGNPTVASPSPTVDSRPPTQLMKHLDGAGDAGIDSRSLRGDWHYLLETDFKKQQVGNDVLLNFPSQIPINSN